jgi:hypothetical protein
LILSGANTLLGVVLGVLGLVPLLAGAFDICLFAPLFGTLLSGPVIRAPTYQRIDVAVTSPPAENRELLGVAPHAMMPQGERQSAQAG